MKTEGIHLSWIVVKDINKAIKFFTNVAGLTLKEFSPEFGWAELTGPEGSILGLAQETEDYSHFVGKNAILTITVDDIHSACEQFKKNSAVLVGELIEVPGHVIMQTFQDADGNTMQLVQKL